jgi:acyl-CoA synthetase (AMP-forming)/AMP-acid ligase II
MVGAKLVFPGAALDGPSLCDLFEAEGVTLTLGVPTVWLGMLNEMEARGRKPSRLERLLVGGSAAPLAMIETFEKRYGITVMHGWGMTEMSPVGTIGAMKGKHRDLPIDEKIAIKAMQGRPMYGVEMKIVDADGRRLPHDGVAVGELLVRGPWIVAGYYKDDKATKAAIDEEGWFRTGDVCSIDPDGYLRVTDRAKDVIKSGGEWISSIDVENAAMGHPDVAEAAVIGLPHPKWSERPLDRGPQGGDEAHERSADRVPLGPHGQMDAARRCRVHRRAAAYGDGQAAQDEAARDLSGSSAACRLVLRRARQIPRAFPGEGLRTVKQQGSGTPGTSSF